MAIKVRYILEIPRINGDIICLDLEGKEIHILTD